MSLDTLPKYIALDVESCRFLTSSWGVLSTSWMLNKFENCYFGECMIGLAEVRHATMWQDTAGVWWPVDSVQNEQPGNWIIGGLQIEPKEYTKLNQDTTVKNCIFKDNTDQLQGGGFIGSGIVDNCYFEGNGIGAAIHGRITNSMFINNRYGLSLSDSVVATNNIVDNNTFGIASNTTGSLALGGNWPLRLRYLLARNNIICNNTHNVRTPWQDTTFDFTGNYWCLIDSASIASLIMDVNDSLELGGTINFMDFDTITLSLIHI